MTSQPSKRKAYDYAERIRARLPHRLQESRVAVGLSKYAVAKQAGITLDCRTMKTIRGCFLVVPAHSQ